MFYVYVKSSDPYDEGELTRRGQYKTLVGAVSAASRIVEREHRKRSYGYSAVDGACSMYLRLRTVAVIKIDGVIYAEVRR